MKLSSVFLLSSFSLWPQCLAAAISRHHEREEAGIAQFDLPTTTNDDAPKLASRHFRWHRHKPGEPYSMDETYFSFELPENKAGWIATGSSSRSADDPTYLSIDPKTNKRRKDWGYCYGFSPFFLRIPQKYECCMAKNAGACRTYRLDPTSKVSTVLF